MAEPEKVITKVPRKLPKKSRASHNEFCVGGRVQKQIADCPHRDRGLGGTQSLLFGM
jgi:hypothetical protein